MARHSKTQSNEITLYFVECDFGKAGLAFVERAPADMNRATTISDIAANQWNAPVVKVLAVTPATNSSEDVTEEILLAAGLWDTPSSIPAPQDRIDWRNDHRADLRKHSEVV